MIYKKNTRTVHNTNNVVIRLSVECDGKQLSAIAYDGDVEIASIISVVHNLNVLNETRCYEVIGVSAVNDFDIMFRLQRFFYNSLHGLGIRYFWFETRDNKLIELAKMLYTLNRIQGTDYYYADLNRMYYHNNEQPNQ
ncbi:MAG: hypothetical protein SO365_05995 [Prevotella sp.]|nr:hypothetical protein [Bacteroidales bacterium]MDY4705919.1 hypothetical protein [Prevotella sp.]